MGEGSDGIGGTGSIYEAVRDAIRAEEPVALVTVLGGPDTGSKLVVRPGRAPLGTLGDPDLDRVVARDAEGELAAGITEVRHYGAHGEAREAEVSVFIESHAPPPRMLMFGAVDFTAALVGPTLGPRDAVCVLTHDAKFDLPAIIAALDTDVGYLGAMGSRRTHDKRLERLKDEGVDDAGLKRVMAPIGLDIGARTPEEVAVSICAEIIALRTGQQIAASLRDTEGPIHLRQ